MSGRFIDTGCVWMEGDVDWDASIENNGGEVLVEEGLEEDGLVPVLQKRGENGVLT